MVEAFFPTAIPQGYLFYKDGVKNGPYLLNFPNGSNFVKGSYSNGQRNDSEMVYRSDGTLKEVNFYKNDTLKFKNEY